MPKRSSLIYLLALVGCVHHAQVDPSHNLTALEARNAAAFFTYRCTNEKAFRARHAESCRATLSRR